MRASSTAPRDTAPYSAKANQSTEEPAPPTGPAQRPPAWPRPRPPPAPPPVQTLRPRSARQRAGWTVGALGGRGDVLALGASCSSAVSVHVARLPRPSASGPGAPGFFSGSLGTALSFGSANGVLTQDERSGSRGGGPDRPPPQTPHRGRPSPAPALLRPRGVRAAGLVLTACCRRLTGPAEARPPGASPV